MTLNCESNKGQKVEFVNIIHRNNNGIVRFLTNMNKNSIVRKESNSSLNSHIWKVYLLLDIQNSQTFQVPSPLLVNGFLLLSKDTSTMNRNKSEEPSPTLECPSPGPTVTQTPTQWGRCQKRRMVKTSVVTSCLMCVLRRKCHNSSLTPYVSFSLIPLTPDPLDYTCKNRENQKTRSKRKSGEES